MKLKEKWHTLDENIEYVCMYVYRSVYKSVCI